MSVNSSCFLACICIALVACSEDVRRQPDAPPEVSEAILANYNTIEVDGFLVSVQIGEKFLHVKTMHSYQENGFQAARMEDFEFRCIDENGHEYAIPKKTGAIPEYTSVMVLVGEALYERKGTPLPRRLVVIHKGKRVATEKK